jgi:hypothetical protein
LGELVSLRARKSAFFEAQESQLQPFQGKQIVHFDVAFAEGKLVEIAKGLELPYSLSRDS